MTALLFEKRIRDTRVKCSYPQKEKPRPAGDPGEAFMSDRSGGVGKSGYRFCDRKTPAL